MEREKERREERQRKVGGYTKILGKKEKKDRR
jgi:hypothetical protein